MCDLQCICCIPHPKSRRATVAFHRAQFERPPLLEALKERKEIMQSEARYGMNQGRLLCDGPWFELRHFSFVTTCVAWATLSATLHGLRCMGYVVGLRWQLHCTDYVAHLRCMGYVVSYIAWATLHGLRCWATLAATLHRLRCLGYVIWATLHGLHCFRNVDKKEPFAKLSGKTSPETPPLPPPLSPPP